MIKRVPIKVHRKPIKLPSFIIGQVKLWELMEETREDDILAIAEHFNMVMMKVSSKAGYNTLSLSNPTQHKNFIHFERVYEICRMKGWDANLYIESQFERAKGWEKVKYPLPHMLYSTGALRFFTNHLSTIIQKYERDTRGKERQKGKETKSLRQIIVDDIVRSAKNLSESISSAKSNDKAQTKALKLFQSWADYSPYYLYSVPWFHDVIKEIDGALILKYREEFEKINKSPMIKGIIKETVSQVEEYYGLPENIQF